MELIEEHYCVRWKGFHSNIVTALEDLKTDEEFVDVTLSCDGRTIQGHKVILSACSPYFKKILKDNPCRHPVLILNDIQLDVLEALMTYMYNGTVSVPHNKLQVFLKTAEALKIKGIVDTDSEKDIGNEGSRNPSGSDSSLLLSPPAQQVVPLVQDLAPTAPLQHPAGDLSLLASAAAESAAQLSSGSGATTQNVGGNAKRRKTAPRKLGTYMVNSGHITGRGQFSPGYISAEEDNIGDTEKENKSSLLGSFNNKLEYGEKPEFTSLNGNMGASNFNTDPSAIALVLSGQCKVSAMNLTTKTSGNTINTTSPFSQQLIPKQEHLNIKEEGSLDLTVKTTCSSVLGPLSPTPSDSPPRSVSGTSQFQMLSAAMLPTSSATPLNLLAAEGASAADQMAALLGPEQMAALLGPSWKSRQPRMCQYCQRMFSNKFNLKQHILNMHTVGRELMCEICQKKVKNKWYLRRHHVTHHGAPLKK